MSHELSRRALIKGGAAAGLLATAGALVGCGNRPNKAPATVAESKHAWEVIPDSITDIASVEDFDIVVVGAGIAGVIAAQSAAEAGAKVVLVEKTDSISARGHDIGAVNTKAHKAEGIVINPAQVRDDYAQLTGNKTDMNLFNIWLEHSGEFRTLTAEVEQSAPSRIFWKNSWLVISGWKTSFLWLTPSRV